MIRIYRGLAGLVINSIFCLIFSIAPTFTRRYATPDHAVPPGDMTGSAPAADAKHPMHRPQWPALSADEPFQKLIDKHAKALREADYDEVYGISLTPSPFHRNLILQRFLRANANNVEIALAQLTATLTWRKHFQPLKAKDEVFSKERYGGLRYVVQLQGKPGSVNDTDIVIRNLRHLRRPMDSKVTFADLDDFMRWRVRLMELSLEQLHLDQATQPIPSYDQGVDPYQAILVHDYLSVSFMPLNQDPKRKAAANKAIECFKNYYPETMSRNFFVNVPGIMG